MAANITLRMNGNVNAQKITNAEWGRLLAYYQGVYTTRDAQNQAIIPTEAQTVAAIYNDFVSGIINNVLAADREAATRSAIAAVPIILPTSDAAV